MARVGQAVMMLVLALFLLGACAGQTPNSMGIGTSGPSSSPPPATQRPPITTPDGTIAPPGGPGAATGLEVATGCSSADPRQEVVELRWTLPADPGTAQWVEITIFSEAFDDGKFDNSGPIDSDQTSMVWVRVAPGAVHFWRILTLHGDTWVPSKVGLFTPGPCIGDFVPPSGS